MKLFYGRKISRKIGDLDLEELRNSNYYLSEKNLKKKFLQIEKNFSTFNLEIGFGSGENILFQAKKNKNICFIGCDPFLNGIVKLKKQIDKYQIKNTYFTNLDFWNFFANLKKIKFDKIYILFPDPWPKKKHNKRRLINNKFVEKLSKICSSKSLIHVLTDHPDYLIQIEDLFLKSNSFEIILNRYISNDLDKYKIEYTKYHKKAIQEKRRSYLISIACKNKKN